MLIASHIRANGMVRTAFFGAGPQVLYQPNLRQPGRLKNAQIIGDGLMNGGKAGVPIGYEAPTAWLLPIRTGGLGATRSLRANSSMTVALAGGRNAEVTLVGAGTVEVDGQLVVSAVATLTGDGTIIEANLLAVLQAVATLVGDGVVNAADLEGVGTLAVTLTGDGTLSVPNYATGTLAADITPFTDLSPQGLAQAVWSADADANADAGTMGEALRLAQIILRNKTVTDPAAGTITVYDVDGTTVLLEADLFEDAAGVTPYSGSGAERRERLS
jgi:hypothetical protein